EPCRERLVHVHNPAAAIEDGDQVRNRVERVLELPARSHRIVDQLQVFDSVRQLAADFVGAIEQVELAAGLEPDPLEHERAERAAAAAQRHGHGDGGRVGGRGDDLGARATQGDGGGRDRIVCVHTHSAGDVRRVGRCLQYDIVSATLVDPDRRAIGAEQTVGAETKDVEAGGQA